MGLYHLEKLFNPGSVAVIGASPLKTSIGHAIMRNLLEGGFQGPIVPINPKYTAIENLRCFETITPAIWIRCKKFRLVPSSA